MNIITTESRRDSGVGVGDNDISKTDQYTSGNWWVGSSDFWLIKLGRIPAEPEDAPTDGEPVQTPDVPGFGAVISGMGLLVLVGLAGRRR